MEKQLLIFLTILFCNEFVENAIIGQPLSQDKRSAHHGSLYDEKHGIKMGIPKDGCDDGKTNLNVDWDGDSVNYTCFSPSTPLIPNPDIKSELFCDTTIPKNYFPQHYCMSEKISYPDPIPTYGNHRPLWPKYGEYRFVPIQRWLHNIEHGAVVMLYNPCTVASAVNKLKDIVKNCIKKHIITPSQLLKPDRPLALVAWGCRLTMSEVNFEEVTDFIRNKGLKGPEGSHPSDGQYDYYLLQSSAPNGTNVNMNDLKLCPNY